MTSILNRLPTQVDRPVRVIAWVYLAAQILLVGTGGLVRLTSSGLGCPTWPKCTEESLVNTPEMGVHGVIEFGNRLLGVALGLLAIAAFVAVVRLRRSRPDLFRLTLIAGLGIPAQALIGGVSVLTRLNPWVVGLHFVVSAALVALCTAFVHRVMTPPGPRRAAAPPWFTLLAYATSLALAATILVGIVTTGSGPHAGDADAQRNGLDPEVLQHVHSWPAYTAFALTAALVVAAFRLRLRARAWTALLLAVMVVQIAVGLWQSRTGLPPFLVGLHMVLACTLVAAMTAVVVHLKTTAAVQPEAPVENALTRRA